MRTRWACLHCLQTFETEPGVKPHEAKCPHCFSGAHLRAISTESSEVLDVAVLAVNEVTKDLGLTLLLEAQT